MTRIEDNCIDCGLPCVDSACPLKRTEVHYCDNCECREAEYKVGNQELCGVCFEDGVNEKMDDILGYLYELFTKKRLFEKADALGVNYERL